MGEPHPAVPQPKIEDYVRGGLKGVKILFPAQFWAQSPVLSSKTGALTSHQDASAASCRARTSCKTWCWRPIVLTHEDVGVMKLITWSAKTGGKTYELEKCKQVVGDKHEDANAQRSKDLFRGCLSLCLCARERTPLATPLRMIGFKHAQVLYGDRFRNP